MRIDLGLRCARRIDLPMQVVRPHAKLLTIAAICGTPLKMMTMSGPSTTVGAGLEGQHLLTC